MGVRTLEVVSELHMGLESRLANRFVQPMQRSRFTQRVRRAVCPVGASPVWRPRSTPCAPVGQKQGDATWLWGALLAAAVSHFAEAVATGGWPGSAAVRAMLRATMKTKRPTRNEAPSLSDAVAFLPHGTH